MPVNFEVKGMLARLLATEDIMVEHKKVETACFNVQTRVLILPMWEKASNNVYDLLLSHEAAHALYTPDEDWTETHKVPQQYVNVVEDARIEKLMKRRYAGLSKTFYNGYKELADQDFFEIGNDDVSKYNFADRTNIYFKIGTHIKLEFTPEEREIIDLIDDCETFDDALEAAEILFKFCNEEYYDLQNLDIDLNIQSNSTDQGNVSKISEMRNDDQKSSGEMEDDSGMNRPNEASNDEIKQLNQPNQPGSPGESNSDKSSAGKDNLGSTEGAPDIKVKTAESLDKAIKDLASKDSFENVYLETPNLDLSQIIISSKDIHNKCDDYWADVDRVHFSEVDRVYTEFKRSAQKEVNFLVKEFESRKAADAYVRATTARTGVLDCTKLHTYKFNDDIFRKITTFPDGKNHGLIFILDWSGSMDQVIFDTIKQLFNLIWFCKKVSIPFEVYAFTTDYPYIKYDDNNKPYSREQSYTPKGGLLQVAEWFSLMTLLTNNVSASTLDSHMKNIFRMAYRMNREDGRNKCEYTVPNGLRLSGTPLNESLIALQQIIPKFQKENNLQKVQCVILTDGDACPIKYHTEVQKWNDQKKIIMGSAHIGHKSAILRNRKTGNTYTFQGDWWEHTTVFLRNLRDMFPNTNFIGIRIISSRDAHTFIRRYAPDTMEYSKIMSYWKKNKSCSVKKSCGYHTYFGISSNSLSQDVEFEVGEDASKSQIKNAFIKSLKTKKTNKKILGEFVELIV